ncbi:TonB-dependent receptor [Hymenobacter metallicola]|uniref:TonB-dependent receptor n=1 Tax=Hymenobacter metallicola TaxID=2563114 RepID=A0A4Z0QIX3_9BACT|nr:TonB-dependent receptor [Hymenobacter metallicola]TGE28632.1 TonB-dependent receptor [Hymenobacter metallicola]
MSLPSSKLLPLAVLLTAAPALAWAQRTGKTGGKIEDAEIEIVKERVNQLPEATRNFEKIKIDPPAKQAGPVTYTYPDFKLPADRLNPSVRVLSIQQEELAPQTGNYLKGAIGNYGTFYGKAYLHNTRSETADYGLTFSHISSAKGPIDKKNSGSSQTSLGLNGETYNGPMTLGAKLDLGRERYNFYGYNREVRRVAPPADSIKQVFSRAAVKVYARNQSTEAPFQYDLGLGFNYWKDNYQASESNFNVALRSGYTLSENSRVAVNGDVSLISHKDSLKVSRPFVQITPAYELTLDRLALSVGATLGYTGDTIRRAQQFNVYPAVRLGYTVTEDKFVVFAGLGGGLQRVTMYDLTTENPWLAPNQRVADTHRGPTVYFGFNSTPARSLSVNAKVTLANDRNLYFYNNSRRDSTKFDLVYDAKATQLLNVHGEILYNAAEQVRVGVKADYNGYKTRSLAEAFHRPAFQSTLFGTYNMYDKLLIGAELYTYSSSYGSGYVRRLAGGRPVGEVVRPTDTVVDLNLRGDYRIMENLSIFALGNNLLGRKYERFLNYPVKGFNVLAGVTYDF